MQTTSSLFAEAIRRTTRDCPALRVVFGQIDPQAASSAALQCLNGADWAENNGVLGLDADAETLPWATMEDGRVRVNGGWLVAPAQGVCSDTRYVSAGLCGGDGGFAAPYPLLRVLFSAPADILGFTLYFDGGCREYATELRFSYYDAQGALIETIEMANDSFCCVQGQGVQNASCCDISILAWSEPERRARVARLICGVIKQYEGGEIISLEILEQIDPISLQNPVKELILTLYDRQEAFNPLDLQGVYKFFAQKMPLRVFCAAGGEEVDCGLYYTEKWAAGPRTLTLTAKDPVYFLDALLPAENFVNASLKEAAEHYLQAAGVSDYHLAAALSYISGDFDAPSMSARLALQRIAQAACVAFYADRQGVLRLEPIGETESGFTLDYDRIPPPLVEIMPACALLRMRTLTMALPEAGKEMTLVNNPFISDAREPVVAAWLCSWLSRRRNLKSGLWPQDPRLEAGDKINVRTDFGLVCGATVLKNRLSFNGTDGLTGETEAII
ncbi:MAG: hypothetical protein FWE85_04880 [Clostridiales bacterium]|nr:hypothetical protein [Clostridiales bacterium]